MYIKTMGNIRVQNIWMQNSIWELINGIQIYDNSRFSTTLSSTISSSLNAFVSILEPVTFATSKLTNWYYCLGNIYHNK